MTAPRHFVSSTRRAGASIWSQIGLPQDRLARMAARRSFVQLKQGFMQAAELAEGTRGHWLRLQVRQANEPIDLWLLRGAVLRALPDGQGGARALRAQLQCQLDSAFPDAVDSSYALAL
jgi:hypothetical protein